MKALSDRSNRMLKVVDSNVLQSTMLRSYLSRSQTNFAVLTDYAAMEAYKGETLTSIFRSMEILSDFPRQVIVLKTTGLVCGLSGRRSGLQRRMIDQEQTRGFQKYCRHLRGAEFGDVNLREQLLDMGREADAQMQRMLSDATMLPGTIDGIATAFTNTELKIIRAGSPIPSQLVRKFFESVLGMAQSLYASHPRPTVVRDARELPNTFLFRMAVCALVWALDWISVGGPKNVRPDKMRNDLVDLNFAAFATYFDGLLSMDQKPLRIYERAAFVLDALLSNPKWR
jgi:hypothetical protein